MTDANKDGWKLEHKIAVAAIVVGLIATLLGIYFVQKNRQDDARQQEELRQQELARQQQQNLLEQQQKADEEERNRPYLSLVTNEQRPRVTGFTHLTFHNTSPTRNAVISTIELRVTDSAALQTIAKYHPRVPPITGAQNDKAEVRLIHGVWKSDFTAYVFFVNPDFHVEADKPILLTTCIVDPKLPPMNIPGELDIQVSGGGSDTPVQVILRSRQR